MNAAGKPSEKPRREAQGKSAPGIPLFLKTQGIRVVDIHRHPIVSDCDPGNFIHVLLQ